MKMRTACVAGVLQRGQHGAALRRARAAAASGEARGAATRLAVVLETRRHLGEPRTVCDLQNRARHARDSFDRARRAARESTKRQRNGSCESPVGSSVALISAERRGGARCETPRCGAAASSAAARESCLRAPPCAAAWLADRSRDDAVGARAGQQSAPCLGLSAGSANACSSCRPAPPSLTPPRAWTQTPCR